MIVTIVIERDSVPFQQILIGTRSDPVVLGHKVKLQQVLLNLVKNAGYAIRGKADGKIVVTVNSDGEEAVLQVADNGCGMPPEVQAKVWEPFFTTKGVGEGTGLGLDTVQRIVKKHRGNIQVTSKPGDTLFQVWLPLADTPA